MPGVVASQRAGFRAVSESWHEFLEFEEWRGEKKRRQEMHNEVTPEEINHQTKRRRWKMMQSMNIQI